MVFYDLPPPAPVTMATRPSNLSSDMSELMYDELYQLKSGYHMIKKRSKNAKKVTFTFYIYDLSKAKEF